MPPKRFFTKEKFFADLQTQFSNKPITIGDKIRQALQRRKPK
ncbi:hypothetical protein LCGC14_1643550 [marine sediment metagenome]|uniref:Uncharacterized protein n=1 Tax=marine sediment metagenome TaxID=412755 RepID=A0A0F9HYV1_9ZZZZ